MSATLKQDGSAPPHQGEQPEHNTGPDDVTSQNPDDESAVGEARSASAEYGGRKGPDPTRYGDWEKNGRCIDF